MEMKSNSILFQELVDYLKTFVIDPEQQILIDPTNNVYFIHLKNDIPIANDFNWELKSPEMDSKFPDGLAGIRMDENFYMLATIPYKFKELDLEEVVRYLHPSLEGEEITVTKTVIDWTDPYELPEDFNFKNFLKERFSRV